MCVLVALKTVGENLLTWSGKAGILLLELRGNHGNVSSSFLACSSRLRSTIRRPHPPQRPVLGHIHCFRPCEIMGSWILLYGAQPCDVGASSWSPPVLWREVDRILLASALSSILAVCPKRVMRRDWTIAVSLGCPTSLQTSFRTNWCHLIPSIIHRHCWLKTSIFRVPVFETAQQSDPYRKIGRISTDICLILINVVTLSVCMCQMLTGSQLASLLGVSATPQTPSRHQTRLDDHMLGLIASPSRNSSAKKPLIRCLLHLSQPRYIVSIIVIITITGIIFGLCF